LIVVTHRAVAIIVARRAIVVVGRCRCHSSSSSPAAIDLIVVFVRRHRRRHRRRIQVTSHCPSRRCHRHHSVFHPQVNVLVIFNAILLVCVAWIAALIDWYHILRTVV
jgi:hypothetical protein